LQFGLVELHNISGNTAIRSWQNAKNKCLNGTEPLISSATLRYIGCLNTLSNYSNYNNNYKIFLVLKLNLSSLAKAAVYSTLHRKKCFI